MVFGLAVDDVSVVARGMAFVAAINSSNYVEALRKYVNRTDMPESIRANPLDETVCR